MNTGQSRFADVSSLSGLDFPDDARAIARTDWDLDGDVDFWIANRSGPQLRFLRNDTPTDHHYLALRLVGQTCNRDAIGARVELTLKDMPAAMRIQTLRAGDGYLSQSSKWVHFGLGPATEIERLVVRWPGESPEEFAGAGPDGHYRLVQGTGHCEPYAARPRTASLTPSQLTGRTASDQVQLLLASPVPSPRLTYKTTDGQETDVLLDRDKPLLLNLWASWCPPCVAELGELARNKQRLDEVVDVLALSVDGLGDDRGSEENARSLLAKLNLPLTTGWATDDLVEKLHLVHHLLFESLVQMPVPSSVLINCGGEIAAIYEGPLSVTRLIDDLRRIDADAESLRESSLPFEGRWAESQRRVRLLPMVWDLVKQGRLDDGLAYIEQNDQHLKHDAEYAKLLALTGYELLERGDVEQAAEQYRAAIRVNPKTTVAHLNLAAALVRLNRYPAAIAQYREALVHSPNDARIHDRLAWLLATAPDAADRDGDEAVRWAESAARATRFRHVLVLETYAAALAEAGRYDEAMATGKIVLDLARSANDQQAIERTEKRLQLFKNRRPFHETQLP